MSAGTRTGQTVEELLQKMSAQSSLPIDSKQIREALQLISDDVVLEGARYKHKHAVEVE